MDLKDCECRGIRKQKKKKSLKNRKWQDERSFKQFSEIWKISSICWEKSH